jgi:hypothetical protein
MKPLLLFLFAGVLFAADAPRLFFSRTFPGSSPAYFEIRLDRSGAAEYREGPDEDNPLTFRLQEAEASEVFDLADKLQHFKNPLESPVKVAFMGTKLLRFENGPEKGEVKFNFTEDLNARTLVDWFERMGESERHRIDLERAAKYDKLGVMQALLLLEVSLDKKRLVAAEQFLPMLDRISKNESYMHTARARAADIAGSIRGTKQ